MSHCEVCGLTGKGAVKAEFVARIEIEGRPGSIGLCGLHFDAWQRVQALHEALGEPMPLDVTIEHRAYCRCCTWQWSACSQDAAAHHAANHASDYQHQVDVCEVEL